MSSNKKPCQEIKHPNLQDGWGCCVCRTFNGGQRKECKHCKHKRCDNNPDNQVS